MSTLSALREAFRWPGQTDSDAGPDRKPRPDRDAPPESSATPPPAAVTPSEPASAPASNRSSEPPGAPPPDEEPRRRFRIPRPRLPVPRLRVPRFRVPRIRLRPLRVPRLRVPGLRSIRTVVAAVYAALADPLAGGDSAARERRAARVRRTGRITIGVALVALLIYAIFPVRTYLNLRNATDRAETQIEVLTEENQRLTEQQELLQRDEEVERRARRDFGWIYPDEDAYGILPAPETSTTTTTAPD